SGFWHQFAMTAHSPIGKNPEEFGVTPIRKEINFAHNDIDFTDETGIAHYKFSFGLKKSLLNYMHGINFDLPLKDWFDFKIPKTTIDPNYIHDCLLQEENFEFKGNSKLIFLAKNPQVEYYTKSKKGKFFEFSQLTFHLKTNILKIEVEKEKADWLSKILLENPVENSKKITGQQLKNEYEEKFEDFELFWFSKPIQQLKENGIILSL
ncbi:MAG: radical SAM protein, partial [Chryseobacterium sp.]|nr:radical SAM protein [Chryseobacterium sp.]